MTHCEPGGATWAAVRALADDIAATAFTDEWRVRVETEPPAGDLSVREAGMAVLFTELAIAARSEEWANVTRSLLSSAVERLETCPMGFGLFAGSTGIAWALNYGLRRGILDPARGDDPDPTAEFDDMLLEHVLSPSSIRIDVITGLIGIGTYALSRLPRRTALRTIEAICNRLEAGAEPVAGGKAWAGDGDSLTAEFAPDEIDGYFPVGHAHGIAGVVAFLSRVIDNGFGFGAQTLLRSAVGALSVAITERLGTPRMMDRAGKAWGYQSFTWCWGDAGAAVALIHAGIVSREPEWVDLGARLARSTRGEIWPGSAGNPCLCHGTAGAHYALAAMARMTGQSELLAHAAPWREATLDYGQRIGDLRQTTGTGAVAAADHPSAIGFLVGSTGVALSLLAPPGSPGSTWDELLQLDPPMSMRV